MKRQIIVTGDNSKTLLIPELNETYHSINGATREALHVFIENGLKRFDKLEKIRVFEMGFGTGLNALLSLNHAKTTPIYIAYESIEKYPLALEEAMLLNHPVTTGLHHLSTEFKVMHSSPWNETVQICPGFTLEKIMGDIRLITLEPGTYDIIFYDAFGPKVQPGLWETGILQMLYHALAPGGCLVTYCAQGQFKRNLREAGFKVERLPGPPGKREMTVALK